MKKATKVKRAVEFVMLRNNGYYKGYHGANAVSKYLNDKYGINVCYDNHANDLFCNELAKFKKEF